jgi:K319L-like, PKD domain/Periplasmic copper-binding protein (NosD)
MSHHVEGNIKKSGLAFCFAAIAIACQPLSAATVCVNPTGASGCQATISAAVAAAASGDTVQVAAGTYKETVKINKTLALIGAGSASTIIDATGLGNGINIDGSASAPKSGVSGVVVSGFTVENANFQGVIIQNASFVTFWNNQVINNDKSLDVSTAEPSCPGLPDALASGEAFDCGEGVNLTGVDHSVISNNVMQHNAGGILVSDDTGATHDNVIYGNLVADNPFDCGITLASHSGLGVYHNTITANQSLRNGLQLPGAGAGVGIFAPGPGSQTYGNVVVNNVLMGNGLPGVAMHNHASVPGAPPVVFDDNVIVGNTISQNGADTADTATSGSTGINIASLAPMNGTVISQNIISQESIAVEFHAPGQLTASLNNFTAGTGIFNASSGTVDAAQNWWGCLGGPASVACAQASGSLTFAPWLTTPFSAGVLPTAPSGGGGGTTPPPSGITIVIHGPGGATSSTNTFTVTQGQVALDASQSTSSNSGGLSYSWQPVAGSSVGIPGGNTATPFIQLGKPGTYQVKLTVTDSTGATASAVVTLQYI